MRRLANFGKLSARGRQLSANCDRIDLVVKELRSGSFVGCGSSNQALKPELFIHAYTIADRVAKSKMFFLRIRERGKMAGVCGVGLRPILLRAKPAHNLADAATEDSARHNNQMATKNTKSHENIS